MRRALRRAVGVLVATGVLGLARPAPAQTPPARLRDQTPPVRRAGYGQNVLRSEGQGRLEEMKVELALLSDLATFPYYLGARAAGGVLEVRGYVPNDAVKQRALELARRHTSLGVKDGLRLQTNLTPQRPLRGADEVRREGAELLAREFGNAGRRLRLDTWPNGVVRVTGPIDSVQDKLAVSRLFRQISGCAAIVNQLTVQPILCDGQRVVPVTRDGSQTAPPSALPNQEPVDRPLEAREEELHLPAFGAAKSIGDRPTASTVSRDRSVEAPIKPAQRRKSTEPTIKPVKAGKSDVFASESTSDSDSTPGSSEALTRPRLPVSWSRPRFNPASETQAVPAPPPPDAPKAPAPEPAIVGASAGSPVAEPPDQPTATPAPDPTTAPVGPAIRSARLWPPAYDVRPPQPAGGRTGTIVFEEEPAPSPAAQASPTGISHAVASADLKQQIKSVCGRKARDVKIEVQPDGSLLVKAKVPSAVAEKELTGKILTIPAMTAPNVHLTVEVSP